MLAFPLVLTGCGSMVGAGNSGSSSFVSTTVNNSTRPKVHAAVKSVFLEDGFILLNESGSELNFRKWGGKSSEIVFGSWFTEGVAAEPEVFVFDKGSGTFNVHCDVYMREHNGSELLDANWKVMASGKMAYNRMMKRIRKRAEGG